MAETLLLSAERLSSAANVAGMPSALDDLREAWYGLLISQHHDPMLTIMGPYQIHEVTERSMDSARGAQRVLDRSASFLADRIRTTSRKGRPVVVFNSLAWARSVLTTVVPEEGETRVVDHEGNAIPAQVFTDEDGRTTLTFLAQAVPGCGWRTYFLRSAGRKAKTELAASKTLLENENLRVELANGLIQSITEKSTGRTVFAANDKAAVGEVFIWEDEGCIAQVRPVDFMQSAKLVTRSSEAKRRVTVVEKGPARATIEVAFELDWGVFRQRISLTAGASVVDFETLVDWLPEPEGGRRVRMALPSAVTNAKVFRDIPFAVLESEQCDTITPINSWLGLADAEQSIAAALIHDGPCSQQVSGDVLWQTLFRSIRMPGRIEDDQSDPPCGWDVSGDTALEEGPHTIRQRLVVFAGTWQDAAVPRESLSFTTPAQAATTDRHTGKLPAEAANLTVESEKIVVCAWKPSDFTDASIVRLYNPGGDPINTTLLVGFELASADETNFREEHTGDLTIADGAIPLSFGPYEIKTVRLTQS